MDKTMEYIHDKSKRLLRQLSHERVRVYSFHAAGNSMAAGNTGLDRAHLSAKGAALSDLTNMGFPIPPGFVLTTDNFTEYLECYEKSTEDVDAKLVENPVVEASMPIPEQLMQECRNEIHEIERKTGRVFGGVSRVSPDHGSVRPMPLLFSVRTGTSVFIPCAMDAILNVGMTDAVVAEIIDINPGYRRFALDTQRRFLCAYGTMVQQVRPMKYQRVLEIARRNNMYEEDGTLSVDGLVYVVGEYRRITRVPDDPYVQLKEVIEAIYEHSLLPRVVADLHAPAQPHTLTRRSSREISEHPDTKGIAVIVQMMVYGNLNSSSGSGACFSRHPNALADADAVAKDVNPAALVLGEFLPKGEGSDVFTDARADHSPRTSMMHFRSIYPPLYSQLKEALKLLETKRHYAQYVEFTVEDGALYILDSSDVNLHGHVKDARFVTYYDLLLDIQKEEEAEEEKTNSGLK